MFVKEAAHILGVKPRSVYDLCREGHLPYTKVSGRVVIPEDAVYARVARLQHDRRSGPGRQARPGRGRSMEEILAELEES